MLALYQCITNCRKSSESEPTAAKEGPVELIPCRRGQCGFLHKSVKITIRHVVFQTKISFQFLQHLFHHFVSRFAPLLYEDKDPSTEQAICVKKSDAQQCLFRDKVHDVYLHCKNWNNKNKNVESQAKQS